MEKNNSLISLNDFISGSCAGIVQVLVGQPLDMMKVRMQTNSKEYFNLIQTFKKITVEESPFAFYKGTLSPLLGISFVVAVQFCSNNFARNYFILQNSKNKSNKNPENLTHIQNLKSGMFAGFSNSFVVSPIEMIRIKMQVQGNNTENKYSGTVDCAKKIYKGYGIKGLYQGLFSTFLREFPGMACYFGVYEILMQTQVQKYGSKSEVPLIYPCIFGALSGSCFWLSCFPFDVVKSRIQSDDCANRKYKNIVSTFSIIYSNSGIGGFFKGIGPCLVRAPIGNSLTFLTFELISSKLKKRKH
jgi:solute carrier family 25 carnitine/acylcarnitine transporter 20/29